MKFLTATLFILLFSFALRAQDPWGGICCTPAPHSYFRSVHFHMPGSAYLPSFPLTGKPHFRPDPGCDAYGQARPCDFSTFRQFTLTRSSFLDFTFPPTAYFCRMENFTSDRYGIMFSVHAGGFSEEDEQAGW
ncbi:MAG TPA: hypothetical protein VFU15_10105 [Bacteroidia bacterium]|nr:hypothetical protein [Bacteroidia bacterium]